MIKQEALPVRDVYRQDDLMEVTIMAGLDAASVMGHVNDGNFRDVPTMMMDLFDMEGNVNEHQSSTGILDCETTYPEEGNGTCIFDAVTGNNKCPTADKNCRTETLVRTKFDVFIAAADTNGDNIITGAELDAVEILYNDDGRMPDSVDFNHGTQTGNTEHDEVEGTVAGAFRLLTQVFGETCDSITVESLETVVIENMYPSHYTFPSSRNCLVASVICPFLATMIKQGALPVQDVYRQDDLTELTINAGIDEDTVVAHVDDGNFRDVPTMMMDLFDMEGNVNEHQSSTGILDCETIYPESGNGSCTFDVVTGNNKCPTADKNCRTETVVRNKFDAFIAAADVNKDNKITGAELDAVEELYDDETVSPESVDFNHGTQTGNEEHREVEGTVAGAFRFLIQVFGESCDNITRVSLETVLIDNRYPSHYTFPSP